MVHRKALFVSFIVFGILASLVEIESTKDVAKSTKHAKILGGKRKLIKSSKKTSTLDSILKAQKNSQPKIFVLNFEKAKLKKLIKTLHNGGNVIYREDPCLYKPCLHHGLCHNDLSRGPYSYICTCSIGFTGSRCQNEVPECANGSCEGGQCLSPLDGSLCRCSEGFEGFLCQTRTGRRSPVYNSVKDDITENNKETKMGRHSMLVLSVMTGIIITMVFCCFIQACRVWSKRSDLKYYYREAIKNGMDVPAPPDTCTICGQICLETFCSCGSAGNRRIEEINKTCAMNQHRQMTQEHLNGIMTERMESPDKSGLNVIRSKISQMSDKSRDILVEELEKRSVSIKPSKSPDVEEWVENLRKASIVLSQPTVLSSQPISQTSARKSSILSTMVNKSEDPEQTKETINSSAESSSESSGSDDDSILSPEHKAMLQNEELENCLVDLVTRLSELEMSQSVSQSKVDIPNNIVDECEDGIHNQQMYDKDTNNLDNNVAQTDQQTKSQDPDEPESPPVSLIRIKSISVVRQPQESTNEQPGLVSQHKDVGIRQISLIPLPASMHAFDPSNTVSVEDNSLSLQPVDIQQGDKTPHSSSRGLNIENPMFHDHGTSREFVSPGSRKSSTQRMSMSNHDPIQMSRNNSSSEFMNRPPNDSIRRVSFTQRDALPLPSLSSGDAYFSSDTEPNSVTSVNQILEGIGKTETSLIQSEVKKECSHSPDINHLDHSDVVMHRVLPNNNSSNRAGIYSKPVNVVDHPMVPNSPFSSRTDLNQAASSYKSLTRKRYIDSRLSKTDPDWSCASITLTPTSIHTIESPNQYREPFKSVNTEDPIFNLNLDFPEEVDQQDIDEDMVEDVVNFNMAGNYLSHKIKSLRQPGEDADDEADEEDEVCDKNNSRSTTGRRKRIIPTISTRSPCSISLQEQITDVLVTGHEINGVAEDVDMKQRQKDDPISQQFHEEFICLPILNVKRNEDQLELSSAELPTTAKTRPENIDEYAKDSQFTIINECVIDDCQASSNNISLIDNSAHILLNRKQNADTLHLQIGETENTQTSEITGNKPDGGDQNLQIVGDKENCELPTVVNMHVTVDINDVEEQEMLFRS